MLINHNKYSQDFYKVIPSKQLLKYTDKENQCMKLEIQDQDFKPHKTTTFCNHFSNLIIVLKKYCIYFQTPIEKEKKLCYNIYILEMIFMGETLCTPNSL